MKAWELFMSNPWAPLNYGFMRDALLIAALVSAVCAILSCYLVLKGWSLMGDAVSHAILPGIVVAYLIGLPLALGAFVAGLICAISTGFIKAHSRVKEDTVLGVVFTGLFALGLVMFSKVKTNLHLDHILFGSLLGISHEQIVQTAIFGGFTLIVILAMRRDLFLFCFDANHARSIGLNTTMLYYVLLSLLSLSIVVSLQAVGIILVISMLITPGCVAYLLTTRFERMLIIAAASAILSAIIGTYLSFFIDGATGACIVLCQTFLFILAVLFAPRRGILAQRFQGVARETAVVIP